MVRCGSGFSGLAAMTTAQQQILTSALLLSPQPETSYRAYIVPSHREAFVDQMSINHAFSSHWVFIHSKLPPVTHKPLVIHREATEETHTGVCAAA